MSTVDCVIEDLKYQTILGFNASQCLHRNHVKLSHPESPERIEHILKRLGEHRLLERCQRVDDFPPADESAIRATHKDKLLEELRATGAMTQEEINAWAIKHFSIFATPDSYTAALSGVACCRTLAELVFKDKIPNAFALIRPPGHHADAAEPSGFCLFNNVAQAAVAALDAGAKRVLILDIDIHHGQGTQRIFYDDPRVLFISVHRFDYGRFYPWLLESGASFIGKGAGEGFTANLALQETGNTDADYLAAFFHLILPLAHAFQPELVVVSAGYDCMAEDPIGKQLVSPAGYAHIIHQLKSLANGRLLLVLEGGYNHRSVADGVALSVRVLLGERPPPLETTSLPAPLKTTVESILNTIAFLRPHWRCFDFYPNDVTLFPFPTSSATFFDPPAVPPRVGDILQHELPYTPLQFCAESEFRRHTITATPSGGTADKTIPGDSCTTRFIDCSDAQAMEEFAGEISSAHERGLNASGVIIGKANIRGFVAAARKSEHNSGRPLMVRIGREPLAEDRYSGAVVIDIGGTKEDGERPVDSDNTYIHIPVETQGASALEAALFKIVLPLAYNYAPRLILLVAATDDVIAEGAWPSPTLSLYAAHLEALAPLIVALEKVHFNAGFKCAEASLSKSPSISARGKDNSPSREQWSTLRSLVREHQTASPLLRGFALEGEEED